MAITNPTARGGASVGSLLRDVSEREKQELAAKVAPQAQPTSPLRQLIRTTLLTPLTPGSERIVGVNPEAMQRPSQIVEPPTQVGAVQTGAPAPLPTGEFVGFPRSAPSMAGGGAPVGQVSAPAQGAPVAERGVTPTTRGGGQVLGASISDYSRPVGRTHAGIPIAGEGVREVSVEVPGGEKEFGSREAFEAAQTPKQNILGGIGKYGEKYMQYLRELPRYLPVSPYPILPTLFREIQSRMAPKYLRKELRFPNEWYG